MVRLIQMCGVRGWILLAVCGLLLTGAALGQDPQKPGAKPAEKVADKPAAKTQSPTTQPTTLPATQGIQDDPAAKLQALREMKEKIRALRDQRERELVEKHKLEQEEARGATGERRTQQPATQPAERPATAVDRKPATTETKKPTPRPTIDELRRRAALSTQEGVTEPGHPDEDEQAAHPDRRREPPPPLGDIERPPGQEAPQVTPLPKDPEEEVREVPTPRRPEGVSQPSGEEPAEPGAKGPEGEWFAFDGMPWEDVVRHMARRIGKPLMYEDQIVIGGELTYHNERIFT
ncbi:MAG: hypothetical protein KKB50_21690, partial [Planctomycetes bacterium]|nr:hypothetical protein [Planctomycetota bacterium]